MFNFCTYFDINYLPKGMCLIESLEKHSDPFRIFVLCMDDESYKKIVNIGKEHVVPFKLSDLEEKVPELLDVKPDRNKIEYYYTCGPAFIFYLTTIYTEMDIITYLDSDMFFFSNPAPLFDLFEGYSIGVVGHHLPEFRKANIWQGLYNVGWLNFRCDKDGLACLKWWRDQCIEWCYERHEDGKYADQLYLDKWPKLFDGFMEFTHHGANVAPWNAKDYKFSEKGGTFYIDQDPLIFYHFHGLKKVSSNVYNTNLGVTLRPPNRILKKLYFSYIRRLEYFAEQSDPTASIRHYKAKHHFIKSIIRFILGLIFRQYLFVKRESTNV